MYALLAQAAQEAPAQLHWIERLLDKYGLAGAILLGIGWLLYTRGSKLIDAQINLTTTAERHLSADATAKPMMATALESIASSTKGVGRTNRVLERFADMAHDAATHAPPELRSKIVPHVEAIREILCDEGNHK